MSLNQSRAERKESHYRRPARPGISAHQRVSSGGVGKGGGGTGLPPASANSQSSSFSTTRSFKKTNGQGTQPRVTGTNANLESSAVHNGARAQPMLPGASNALFTNASAKPIDMHNQRSQQTASSAPNSASASGTSESAAPTTPVRADASKGVSLQFGSFSPNIVSGLQIPARTSSAPPNLDEQKRDQARHDSFGSVPLLPTSSISNRQQSREDVEQSKIRVPHHPSHDKRGVRAQAPAYSGATSAKSSSTPVSGASMAIPFQQSQGVQFGVPTPKIQAQGMATTSLQMPILGHSSQVQQQVFVPSIQAPPLQPQGMMRQGQGLNYPPQVGHQVSSQMGNLVIGMGSHFAQQQPGNLGAPRVSIKITDPKTHEELRLDKRADTDLNGGLFGHGSHANMPLQPQPVVYGPSHQVNYFSHIHPNSVFFQNPASLSLTSTTQMAPNSQASVGGQGSHVLAFKNPSLLNHSPAYKTGPPMHGVAVSSNLEHGHGAETLISAASSVSEQVAVRPAALSNENTVGPPSVSVSSNADNRSEATKLSRPHNATESLDSQGDSKIHMEISVQQSKSISVLSSPRRTETVRRIDSMEDQSKKPWKKDQHHFQMQQQANTLDSADHLAMKAYKEVAKFTENMLASSEKVEPSTSVLEDPSSGLEHVTSAGNRIPETVESEATPASSETCRDVAVSPGEALPGGVACVPVVEGCVCETSNKSSVEIVFDEFNGVSSAKQDNCTSLDIQLKNENTGLAEHMKTEQSEYPQLDNNYNDDKVNIPSVLSSNTSADCKNVDMTPSVFCNKHGTVETEQNMLEGASGCGSIVNEKTDNNIERSTAFANGSDSNVGSHFMVSSSSELRTSTLRGSKGESGLMDGQEASHLESGLAHEDTAHVPIPSVSDAVLKVEEKVSEEVSDDLVQFSSSGLNDNKHTTELNKVKSTTSKAKKKRKEFLQKAELAGTTSDLYMAYKGPEEKPQPSVSSESVDGNSGISTRQPHSGSNEEDIASKEDEKSIVEPDDWEDAADAPKLENSDKIEEINGGLRHHEEDGAASKKYSRDFLLTLKDQCADLPAGFDIADDMVEALMGSKASISKSVERNPPPSPGRVINRPIAMSRPDFHGAGMVDDDRWFKSPVPFPFNQDHHVDVGQGGNTVGFRLGQGGTHGNMRNLRGQIPGQYIVGLQSGPLLPLESYGGIQRNGPDADRWQRASGFQKGLIPSPQSPMQVIHKAANKYEVGKVTDAEAAKQRQLKAILNKLTPQNFDRLFEQVKEVNIDNAVTLTGVISQIFDKALMEPTFCEMYANFCHDLAGELPDFVEDNEKITFKRLLLNKCQEEFERGEREQAEADKVDGDGKVKQSAVEREEKRVQARRRMLGNIRLIGELYKKRMLTERIMHECIQKLLGQYPNPEEEDIEALCKLMSTIGEMIDHPKAKEHMDVYFETMTNLSTNMKLSSRVRFMLKDSIDLRKNKWQQRRKVDGPKKIEEVHRDAAQERQQVNRLARSSSISSSSRRGQPSDFGPRASIMFSPPTTPQGAFRGGPPQLRGFGTQGIRFEDRHSYENRTLSVPLSHRPVDDNVITLGPQGGLARGMSMRGPAILSGAPLADVSTGPGESRRIRAGPNGYSSATEWMLNNSRQEPMTRNVQERFMRSPAYDHSNSQEHGVYYGDRDLNNADRSFDRSMAGSAATHVLEDELRAFQGGKDGDLPCVWEDELSSFPQPETVSKMVVNQKLLCFGTMFASQDSGGMLSLLGMIEQCLKAGKKQTWHAASVTNICVGLLAGLKALLALRPQPLGSDVLSSAQAIFLSILAEGDICASQRRAASEGLGLLARLGNDMFTARLTRLLHGDVTGAADLSYAGSIAFALGCIHRSAGGMALSSLVPATVNSISLLAKSSIAGLQVWFLHGLLLTIEAAGLSYVSHVQATLGLAMDILLSEENGWVDLQQGVGRLINAIVAVLGPELAPGSIFFSRCKSVVAEISCQQETATLLESVRFTQQLVLFAPQAVTVHYHVQTLLLTLSSRQPTLRHLAVSTLRHLIEKDPASVIDEQIEDTLFHMLDEETDTEIGNLVRSTIMRLLYASCPLCPSHWLSICRAMVLATSTGRDPGTNGNLENDPDGDTRLNFGDDDENMVSSSKTSSFQGYGFDSTRVNTKRDNHLRYRTRVFAAECLSHLPAAVGKDLAHFDLSVARKQSANGLTSGDWLVLHVQELISLAYQISTIQFENMRPIGVGLLSTIMDKFEMIPDPDLPGHLLLEQYQAQLVSAVRTALDTSSGPILLEAGLQLATKILTNGIISGDQIAVKRIFSLISHPLNNFEDLYYPSFAEWVSCKIKIRLLTAHASLKCYTYAFLRKQHAGVPDEYLAQLPLFSESSSVLGKYWISILKDYSYVCFRLHLKQKWKPFLDGIQSPLVSTKLQPCLEEAWPVILQAVALDAVPVHFDMNLSSQTTENNSNNTFISGYSMVQLKPEEFQFLWGFALLVLFQGQDPTLRKHLICLGSAKAKFGGDSPVEDTNPLALKLYEIVLPVFQLLSAERFFSMGFLTLDICRELLQVFSYSICSEDTWDSLAISVLSEIVQNCPKDFLEAENFASLVVELCLAYLFKIFQSYAATCSDNSDWEDMISVSLTTAKTLLGRLEPERQLKSMLAFLLIGYKYIRGASTELCFSKANDFVQCMSSLLKTHVDDKSKSGDDGICYMRTIIGACLDVVASLTKDCIESIHLLEKKRSSTCKLLQMKLAFALKQMPLLAKLAYEIEYPGENQETNPILFTVIQHCTKCIQSILTDTNIQVQAIGLQVLKSIVQRGNNSESNSFLLFFNGELLRDIFTIIDKMLKKPINTEAVAIASECLRILVILQTLSKASECQKGLMNLLLEAIVMVFSASDDDLSQELNDLRSTAGKLVSQLAQIPSSAVLLKDVLLAMPVSNRLQLQGIIRASVTQEHNTTQMKSTMPSLVIKLPVQTEETREKGPTTSTSIEHFDDSSEEKEEEEEDDWDTFQSFPASTNEVVSSSKVESSIEEPALVENPSISDFNAGNSDFEDHSDEVPPDNVKEVTDADQKFIEGEMISDAGGGKNQIKESHGSYYSSHDTEQRDGHHHQEKDGPVPSPDDQSLSDLQSVEVAEGFTEPCDDHFEERRQTFSSNENQQTSDLQSVNVAEACIEPFNDHHGDNIQAELSCENDQVSDLQYVDSVQGYTEPFDDHHQDGDETVAFDYDSDLALSDLQSIEDAKRSVQLNIAGDDEQSKRSPGEVNDLPGSSDPLHPKVFSDFKHPMVTEDKTQVGLNVEANEEAANKMTAKNESADMHDESSEGSGLPEGVDNSTHVASNVEADEEATNKMTAKNESTNMHDKSSECSGLPEGVDNRTLFKLNVEADEEATNKTTAKNEYADMHDKSSKGSGLPQGADDGEKMEVVSDIDRT